MKRRALLVPAMVLLLGADAPKKVKVPQLNRMVLKFAKANLGKKVGDGECATLAQYALQAAGVPDSSYSLKEPDYIWGKLVRTVTAGKNVNGKVLPGDILQFRDAFFKGQTKGSTYTLTVPHHTAIVATVEDNGAVLELLNQNVGDSKEPKTVQRTTIRLADLQKGGWVKIYRPVP